MPTRIVGAHAHIHQPDRTAHARSSRIVLVEQKERDRIARILHDDLQQMLVSVQMRVHLLVTTNKLDPEAAHGLLEDLGKTIEMSRELTVDLSPPVLAHEGLAEALIWLQSIMRKRHNLEVTVNVESDPPAHSREVRVMLFQIVRELLFNVVKHAGTGRACIILRAPGGAVEVEVLDDGPGLPADSDATSGCGFGLTHVREQVELLGGSLSFHNREEKGCRVVVRLPATANVAAE